MVSLLSNIIPFAGSGLLGYAMGFALKKVLKWMLIIVGFLAGMFFVFGKVTENTPSSEKSHPEWILLTK